MTLAVRAVEVLLRMDAQIEALTARVARQDERIAQLEQRPHRLGTTNGSSSGARRNASKNPVNTVIGCVGIRSTRAHAHPGQPRRH